MPQNWSTQRVPLPPPYVAGISVSSLAEIDPRCYTLCRWEPTGKGKWRLKYAHKDCPSAVHRGR